jgi:hypothetical protein
MLASKQASSSCSSAHQTSTIKQVRSCLTPWQLGKGKVKFSTCGQHSEMLVSRHKNYETTAAIKCNKRLTMPLTQTSTYCYYIKNHYLFLKHWQSLIKAVLTVHWLRETPNTFIMAPTFRVPPSTSNIKMHPEIWITHSETLIQLHYPLIHLNVSFPILQNSAL